MWVCGMCNGWRGAVCTGALVSERVARATHARSECVCARRRAARRDAKVFLKVKQALDVCVC